MASLEGDGPGASAVSFEARAGRGHLWMTGNRRKGPNFPDLMAVVYGFTAAAAQSFRRRPSDKLAGGRQPSFRHFHEAIMNEDAMNVSVRKFLKKVGITSQREIEQAVRAAISGGRLKGNEALPAKVTLTVEGIGLAIGIEGAIELE